MQEKQTILTTCTRDCPDNCGIIAHVSCGRLVGLTGVRGHEITGPFLCRKSVEMIQRVYSPQRILKPLKKINGEWQEISWNKALDEIADKIKETIDKYGSLAILHYQSGGSLSALKMLNKRFFNLLGGVTEASGSLCGGAAIAGQKIDFGYRTCHDPLDHKNSKLIILWGRNPVDTNMHLIPILKVAQTHGARVILIDPIATDTVKFVDLHISTKPGMDGYLALAMAKIILDEGLEDKSFIKLCCDNFEEYKNLVDSYSLEELSKLSGVAVDDIQLIAEMYAKVKPAAIICGWGLQRYRWGAEAIRLIDALAAITGNIGISGGGVSHGRNEYEFFDESVKGNNFAKHTRKVPKPLISEILPELDEPPIKMVFVNSANPVNQSPNAKAVKNALENIETVVVFEQFMTDTAKVADYVLPVTTFLEETDVVASYWHYVVGSVNPVIEPVGEAKSDLQIYQELAMRLGIAKEMKGTPDEWLQKIIKPLTEQGVTLNVLRQKHKRIPNAPSVPFENKLFNTSSGRINLITKISIEDFTTNEYPLVLLSVHSRKWIHSQILEKDLKDEPAIIRVNPSTMNDREIQDGEVVKVVSRIGELKAKIKFDENMMTGIAAVKQGRWLSNGQSVNQLTQATISDEGSNACFYQTAVRIEKLG